MGTGPASTISGATLLPEVSEAIVWLEPGVERTVVVVGGVEVVVVPVPPVPLPPVLTMVLLLLLPPQPTANHNAEIKITKPIFRTVPPLAYIRGVDTLRDHCRNVSLPAIGAHVASRMHYQARLFHRQRRVA